MLKSLIFEHMSKKYAPEYTRADIGSSFKINIFN